MKISQREARRLQQRVRQLERERSEVYSRWLDDMPSFTAVGRMSVPPSIFTAVRVSRMLKHAVIAVNQGDGDVVFFAAKNGGIS